MKIWPVVDLLALATAGLSLAIMAASPKLWFISGGESSGIL